MKKAIIAVIACVTAAGGALYSLSGSAAGTIDPDNRSFNSAAVDEAVAASVTDTIPERISPAFTPVKRIKGDISEVLDMAAIEDNVILYDRFEKVYGYKAYSGNQSNGDDDLKLILVGGELNTERLNEMLRQMVKDGYAYQGIDMLEGKDFLSDEYILNYCDLMNMMCNAYNDPAYEISDTDRVRLLSNMELSIDSLFDYARDHSGQVPEEVKETIRYEQQTWAAEYGYEPFTTPSFMAD